MDWKGSSHGLVTFSILFIILSSLISLGFTQDITESARPSNIPPGTEIIYLDENGKVIGNKTLILPDGFKLKFNGEQSTSAPTSSETSQSTGTSRGNVRHETAPTRRTVPKSPFAPSIDWAALARPTEELPIDPAVLAKLNTRKAPEVPSPTSSIDWAALAQPTEELPIDPAVLAKLNTRKEPEVPSPTSSVDWAALAQPTEELPIDPAVLAKLNTRKAPEVPSPTSSVDWAALVQPTEELPIDPAVLAKLNTYKAPEVPSPTPSIDWASLAQPTEELPIDPAVLAKLSTRKVEKDPPPTPPIDWAALAKPPEGVPIDPAVLAKLKTRYPSALSTSAGSAVTENPLSSSKNKAIKPEQQVGNESEHIAPEIGYKLPNNENNGGKSPENQGRPKAIIKGYKQADKSDVFTSRRKTNSDDTGLKGNSPIILNATSKNENKESVPANRGPSAVIGSNKDGSKINFDQNLNGRIKSVGVKTTITTSFKIAKTSNVTVGDVKNGLVDTNKLNSTVKENASTKQSISNPDLTNPSSISRSGQPTGSKIKTVSPREPLINLQEVDALKDIKLDSFKLGVPINITTGNYTITLFSAPPKKDTTGAPKPTTPSSTKDVTKVSTTVKTEDTTETEAPKRSRTRPKGGLRWPLTRRRKVSTARRFLLRTRKPLPTRRTPRPLRPTKSSRPYVWRPRSRAPPRFTTRLSIFKKFQTIPTKKPTTTSTTTEHVYTRKPVSETSLTSDFIKSSGVIKLEDGVEWTNSLADKNSKEFKTLALDLKVLLQEVFKNSVWAPVFIRVDIDGFYKGSVVCDFDVIFKRAIANRIKPIHLKKILMDTLNRDGGQLGVYTINDTSVIFDAFTDLVVTESTKPKSEAEVRVLPQWAIAAIVISIASLLFLVLFSSVAYCNKPFSRKRQVDRFLDDGGDIEKPPLSGYDNLAVDTLYDLEEWKRPEKQSKQYGRGKGKGKRGRDRYYDSWKTEWSGYKGPTRPAISEF